MALFALAIATASVLLGLAGWLFPLLRLGRAADVLARIVGLWPFWYLLPVVAGEGDWSRRRRIRFALLASVGCALAVEVAGVA